MKKQTHLTDDQLIALLSGHASDKAKVWEIHLDECSDCRTRHEEFHLVLRTASRIPPPVLSPAERVDQFERAWERSGRGRQKQPVRWNEMWRYACSFGLGLLVGVVCILAFMQETRADNRKEESARLRREIPQPLRGKDLETVYSRLENPIIIVERTPDQTTAEKQILYGTIDEGKVQVIWNM